MVVTGYQTAGVAVAVDLVNAVTTSGGDDSLGSLRRLLVAHRFAAEDLTPAQAAALRRWARRLRPIFEARSPEDAADRANAPLAVAPLQPHISDHGLGLHLHYAAPGAALVTRLQAVTAVHLAELICRYGLSRSGTCSDPRCDRVYADTSSRNAARRYCSVRCANRANVARFRERARAAQRSSARASAP